MPARYGVPQTRVTPDEASYMKRLYAMGYTYREVAFMCSRAIGTVFYHLNPEARVKQRDANWCNRNASIEHQATHRRLNNAAAKRRRERKRVSAAV